MTARQVFQWIIDHWPQISATIGAILYFIMNMVVGQKECPLPGEGRLSFWWRVAGRAACATFKNIYGTWKYPTAKQPREFVVATFTPDPVEPVKSIHEEVTDKNWPAPSKGPPGASTSVDDKKDVSQQGGLTENLAGGPPGFISG